MNILILNQDWLKAELSELGYNVVTASIRGHCDIPIPGPLTKLEELLALAPQGFKPDCIIVHDESAPFYISDLLTTDIPVIFYSVDTHHHALSHIYSSFCFSHTFIAQCDYLNEFRSVGLAPEWLPLWASRYYEPSDIKKYSAVFVGTMDPKLNSERVAFFNSLKEKIPLHCTTGEYWKLYPHSSIILNQTVKSDLNFRVFEALMSGAALLTEKSSNGLLDLFEDGVDLVTYEKNSVSDAAEKAKLLLADPQLAKRIGQHGRETVLAKHLPKHRAEIVSNTIAQVINRKKADYIFARIPNQVWLIRKLKDQNHCSLIAALADAINTMKAGLNNHEKLDEQLSQYLINCCIEYDMLLNSNIGKTLLSELELAYPEISMFKVAKVWSLLNEGSINEARRLVNSIACIPPDDFFEKTNTLMTNILGL